MEALLATRGIAADTHRGVRQMLPLHFIRNGPLTVELGRDHGQSMSDRDLADYGLGASLDLAAGANSAQLVLPVLRPLLAALSHAGESGVALVKTAADASEAELGPDPAG